MYGKCIPYFDKILYLFCRYKMHAKVCQNIGYILYTTILIYKRCKSKTYIICIPNLYRMHIQAIVCKMDPAFQHILTCLLCIPS